ncbi:hypothetical protein OG234_13580 [Streptomyces sp. NBC_01420]|uniref:hypothetical protein n=1 Tax=Streptomyces sp. NBC_01420 TaxID=2903858 RepID=UPI00324E3FE2
MSDPTLVRRGGEWLSVAREFVGAPETHTYWRGMDLVAIAAAASRRGPLPVLRDEEPRIAALVMCVGGVSGPETARRLGTYERKVTRWRLDAGLSEPRAEEGAVDA